ncbi:HAD family hydrolase [Natronoglycomyces albus]|uniref:HAD family phosphatase n=1 Tax=Natronoglycomyces albus TaxID=2811108 RepID=A0A895XWX0_9ACTN|nr:HAD family phosphatase [Natronoglycomyces albus]QSB06720.1 HAD family phosphatase [Natronoglycomyces albus]
MTDFLHAVLFDMDGTLVDSESLWDVALEDMARELGGTLRDSVRIDMVGKSEEYSIPLLLNDLGRAEEDTNQWREWVVARMTELLKDGVEWQPGAQELLGSVVEAGYLTALVTATRRSLTEVLLDQLGRHNFTITITGDDVTEKKPAPEPYTKALAQLGVTSDNAIVIEDSWSGMTSGIGAGCTVVGVPSLTSVPQAAPGQLHIVDSLEAINVEFLRRLHS